MAKGNRNYVMSGKVGNSVLYKLTDSNNKDIQGERTYVAKIANPKTVAQCIQRVKMDPAVRFYRAFKEEILDHSFEGVKYGGKSHNRFSKLALIMRTGFPYCTKDENVLAPGNYVMAEGSLNQIPFEFLTADSVLMRGLRNNEGTVGGLTAAAIDNLPWVKNGDQITFAAIVSEPNQNPFPIVERIVLDASSTATLSSVLKAFTLNTDGEINLNLNVDSPTIHGFALILSRPSVAHTSGSISWLRSNSSMAVNTINQETMSRWFTNAKYQEAISSYMKTSQDVSSDWYLNQGKLDSDSANIPYPPVDPADVTVSATAAGGGQTKDFPAVGAAAVSLSASSGSNVTITVVTNAPDQVNLFDSDTNLQIQAAKSMNANGFTMTIAIDDLGGVKADLRADSVQKTGSISFSVIQNP